MKLLMRKKTPAEMVKLRSRIINNVSPDRHKKGIEDQYRQLNDPEFAKKILFQNLKDITKKYSTKN